MAGDWLRPEDIDRAAASRAPEWPTARASAAEVSRVLNKALITGRLIRIPKKPAHRDIVLAILCVNMRRRYPYTEPEINAHLREALQAIDADTDHVTCRRYLIDLEFLKRNRGGTRYLLNYPRVESVLSEEAMHSVEALIEQAQRQRRR